MTPRVLALIPARAGSKSIVDKNIMSFRGKPLFVHSIDHALACPEIDRVIVSTDSPDYAARAVAAGAEAPFLRPDELAGDSATDLDAFVHALTWLDEHDGDRPDIVVHLRPTCPIRNGDDISAMINQLAADPTLDSVRAVSPAKDTPFKMWTLQGDRLQPIVAGLPGVPEPWNSPRQDLPAPYIQNAAIDVTRRTTILDKKSMTGTAIGAYVMNDFIDIDVAEDVGEAWSNPRGIAREGATYCIDIDGVIAHLTPQNHYAEAAPRTDAIAGINALYEAGNRIVLFTARGSATGIDWTETTARQMADWGVKHHELRFGKPAADYYVDDRNLPPSVLLTKES